nr:YjcZ family sporulation protein [Neobacillus sp. Marseille-Q6967]
MSTEYKSGFEVIVILFILLIIIGASFCDFDGGYYQGGFYRGGGQWGG